MTRTVIKLALGAAMILIMAGCVYEPAPYGYAPAPAYGGYYGPAYYGPSVVVRPGGYWHHGDRD